MSDIATALKAEVVRLARKEIRAQLEPLKQTIAASRSQISAMRAEIIALQKQLKQAGKQPRTSKQTSVEDGSKETRQRFTAKGFHTLRIRLGLSYEEMGKLVGASDQSIRKWEDGSSTPRQKYQQKIFDLRGIGKKQVADRLKDTESSEN